MTESITVAEERPHTPGVTWNHKDTREDIISVFPCVSLGCLVNKLVFYCYREPQGHQGGHHSCFPLCRDELSSNQISLLITTENHKVIREHNVGVCPVGSVGSVLIQMFMYTTTVATENHNKKDASQPL